MADEPDKTLFGRPPEDESPPADAPPTWAPTLTPEAPQIEDQPRPESAAPAGGSDELLTILRRMEAALQALRAQLETLGRERRYREFSAARLIGGVLQVLVAGFVFSALADWIYGQPVPQQVVKVGLAGVLQLGALTAFLLARGR